MPALITLTTDFGTSDSYVAELKGVLLTEGPADLRLVDLSHELAPFDVAGAALFVRAALPRFPAGAVHIVVVDPGVGSARRPLVVELPEMTLVGPDNGLFGYLYDGRERVYEIEPARLGHRPVSRTFHGRDLFAPVAARLSSGITAAELGTRIESYQRLRLPLVDMQGDVLHGRVIHIDRFGNAITNISDATLRGFVEAASALRVSVGEPVHAIEGLVDHYAQAKPGALLALIGSSGLLEVAAREGSAALKLNLGVGSAVSVQRRS
ncbi:MAG: hypothetical protein JWN48_5107 [Myxococcaceae bacterium]|nr:hypothetical protein [Myxococcaceae bacterium]